MLDQLHRAHQQRFRLAGSRRTAKEDLRSRTNLERRLPGSWLMGTIAPGWQREPHGQFGGCGRRTVMQLAEIDLSVHREAASKKCAFHRTVMRCNTPTH